MFLQAQTSYCMGVLSLAAAQGGEATGMSPQIQPVAPIALVCSSTKDLTISK